MTVAICPGSFDPPTNGHVDVIRRARSVFDEVIVAVVDNPAKNPMFTVEERVGMLKAIVGDESEVASFSGLLVDFVVSRGAHVVVKGLRAGIDFEYELQMAQMNRRLKGVETVFMATRPEWSYLSSSLIKEVASLGGSITDLVPPNVLEAVMKRTR